MLRSLTFCISLFALGAQAHAGVLNVYLQGGQSNSVGYAPSTEFSAELQAVQDDVLFYQHNTATYNAAVNQQNQVMALQPVWSETALTGGPELAFGRDMAAYHGSTAANPNVAIIKYAVGGSGLTEHGPAGKQWFPNNAPGDAYNVFIDTVTSGMAALQANNPGDTLVIQGMIWHQGETDGGTFEYEPRLDAFVADIRARYGANLPFIIGDIGGANKRSVNLTRQKFADIASQDPFMGHAVNFPDNPNLVDNTEADTAGLVPQRDNLHFNGEGQEIMGERFAAQMQLFVPANPVPEPASLGLLAIGGTLLLRRRRRA